MKQFWNERYSEEQYAYGESPNEFFKKSIDSIANPGRLLLPAEGEGRNAVYAAKQGWNVLCFDISDSGKKKAEALAKRQGVEIDYRVGSLEEVSLEGMTFDCVALIFAHLPPAVRVNYHTACAAMLRDKGMLILEGFSKSHLAFNAKNPKVGGPKKVEMLFSKEELEIEFSNLDILQLTEEVIDLDEGEHHRGRGAVIRIIAQSGITLKGINNTA